MKIKEASEVRNFEIVRHFIYVGVYWFEYSNTPCAMTNHDKNELIKQLNTIGMIDKTKPIRLYTIVL